MSIDDQIEDMGNRLKHSAPSGSGSEESRKAVRDYEAVRGHFERSKNEFGLKNLEEFVLKTADYIKAVADGAAISSFYSGFEQGDGENYVSPDRARARMRKKIGAVGDASRSRLRTHDELIKRYQFVGRALTGVGDQYLTPRRIDQEFFSTNPMVINGDTVPNRYRIAELAGMLFWGLYNQIITEQPKNKPTGTD